MLRKFRHSKENEIYPGINQSAERKCDCSGPIHKVLDLGD